MYESFFGLKNAPFRITPDTQTFFGGGKREELLNALLYTIDRGEGMVKVVGEVGSGKTTLLRKLAVQLSERRVWLVYINSPNMPPSDILMFICHELGLPCEAGEPKFKVIERLQKRLLQAHSAARKVVLLIDEAQSMPLETLEELRLLSNLETDTDKLLQVVMFGQPELDRLFDNPAIRQIRDRVGFELQVEPFSRDELAAYLNFRMRVAGYIGHDLFNPKVVREMYRVTAGYPRRVNLLADKVLLAAFTASQRTLNARLVPVAQGEDVTAFTWPRVLAGVVFSACLLASAAYLYSPWPLPTLFTAVFETREVQPEPVTTPSAGAVTTQLAPQQLQWVQLNVATQSWLQRGLQQGQQFTLQLMSGTPPEALQALTKYSEWSLHAYRYNLSQQPLAVVLYGRFSTPEEARRALGMLPEALVKEYRPFVRALSELQVELEQQLAGDQPHL